MIFYPERTITVTSRDPDHITADIKSSCVARFHLSLVHTGVEVATAILSPSCRRRLRCQCGRAIMRAGQWACMEEASALA